MTRIGIYGECPQSPNSLSKITTGIATGLAQAGHRVTIYCPAWPVSPYGDCGRYNPRRDCHASPAICEALPDVELTVCTIHKPPREDLLILYGYPTEEPTRGVLDELVRFYREEDQLLPPMIGYVIDEVARPPTLFHLAHHIARAFNHLAFPTLPLLSMTVETTRMESPDAESHWRGRLHVVEHGIPPYYRPGTCESLRDTEKQVDRVDYAMIARNNVRKRFDVALRAVLLALGNRVVERARVGLYILGEGLWSTGLAERANRDLLAQLGDRVETYSLDQGYATAGVTEEELVQIYCNIDMLVYASMGEAYGLIPFEYYALTQRLVAVARGVPQLDWALRRPTREDTHRPAPYAGGYWLNEPDHQELAEVIAQGGSPVPHVRYWDSMSRDFVKLVDKALGEPGARPHEIPTREEEEE